MHRVKSLIALLVLCLVALAGSAGAQTPIGCIAQVPVNVLTSFSDYTPIGQITPQIMRNFACSTPLAIPDISQLRTNTVAPASINVLGQTLAGDGGGAVYAYNPLDHTSPDNGTTIIVDAAKHRWYRSTPSPSFFAPNVATMKSLTGSAATSGTVVMLQGYRVAGDMPDVSYVMSSATCSLNSGAGDGGSQIPSVTGGCWMITPQTEWDPRWWGAYGDVIRLAKTPVAVTNGSCTFSVTGGTFSSADVGKRIGVTDFINSTTPDGATYTGRITAASGTSVTTASPCPTFTTAISQNVQYGHDDAVPLNAMFTYIASLSVSSPGPYNLTPVNGAGKIYGVAAAPVVTQASNLHFHDATFVALGSSGIPCASTSMLTITGTTVVIDHIEVDSAFLPVNSMNNQASGYTKFDYIVAHHWMGTCQSATISATAPSGNWTLTTGSTGSVANGWVARGNSANGVPERSSVVNVQADTRIVISKPTTSSLSGTNITLSQDASGIINGYAGGPSGGSWGHINSYQWFGGDQQISNLNDRYGYDFVCTGLCNGMTIDQFLMQYAVSEVFADSNTNGFSLSSGTLLNGGFDSTEVNPPNLIMAFGANNLYGTGDVSFQGGSVQSFSGTGVTPLIAISGFRQIAGSGTFTPNSLVQIWSNAANTDASRVVVDQTSSQPRMGPFTSLIGYYGPGTFAQAGNNFQYSVALTNLFLGYVNMPVGGPLLSSQCGKIIYVNNGAPVTLTLPNNIPELGISGSSPPNSSCQYYIYSPAPFGVTLQAPSGSNLNNVMAGGAAIGAFSMYTVSSTTINGGNFQDWTLTGGSIGTGAQKTILTASYALRQLDNGTTFTYGGLGAAPLTIPNSLNPSNANDWHVQLYNNSSSAWTLTAGAGTTLNVSGSSVASTPLTTNTYYTLSCPVNATGTTAVCVLK